MIAYKFLGANGAARFSGFTWPLPEPGNSGPWVSAAPALCATGIHACHVDDLPYWIDAELWRIELDGEVAEGTHKIVALRGRLLERVDAWNDETMSGFSAACAERALALAVPSPELCGYADDTAVFAEAGKPAVAGFVTARLAELAGGAEGYETERAAQARWLAKHLDLAT